MSQISLHLYKNGQQYLGPTTQSVKMVSLRLEIHKTMTTMAVRMLRTTTIMTMLTTDKTI